MLMQKQKLKISYYLFTTLQVVNSLCSVFNTACDALHYVLLPLGSLAGRISLLRIMMPEVREYLLKMSIIHIDCMTAAFCCSAQWGYLPCWELSWYSWP